MSNPLADGPAVVIPSVLSVRETESPREETVETVLDKERFVALLDLRKLVRKHITQPLLRAQMQECIAREALSSRVIHVERVVIRDSAEKST